MYIFYISLILTWNKLIKEYRKKEEIIIQESPLQASSLSSYAFK